jgi:hypothetical protein
MLSERRAAVWWGLALTAVIHAALWLVVSLTGTTRHSISSAPAAMAVRMVPAAAAPVALPPAPGPEAALQALPPLTEPPPPPPLPAVAPDRDTVAYYEQDELEHKVVVLKDETGELELDAPRGVVMHLFIDTVGNVTTIRFEGSDLTATQREKLRDAFLRLKFTPGIKDGHAVPSRIKIALTGPDGLD